jgi:hypothetical protein
MDRYFNLTFWLNRICPVSHGYTPRTEEDTATFRFGPCVVGWEIVKEPA